MDVLNERREGEPKEKPVMVDKSLNNGERKRGVLLIDINHERIQVDRKRFCFAILLIHLINAFLIALSQ
jgi:DNA polymerase IIIc chi subunit